MKFFCLTDIYANFIPVGQFTTEAVFDLLWLVLGCGKLWIADGIWNAMPNLQDGQCNSSYFQVAK